MRGNEKVLIVGGGIAGLAAATGLCRLGIRPTIVERTREFGAVGAGIVLSVNAMAMLRMLGLGDAALEAGRILENSELTNAKGQRLFGMNFADLAPDFGPTITIHRATLHKVLLSGCQDAKLHANLWVDHLHDLGESVEATFSDGRTKHFDHVIGADGLRSQTREQIFGRTDTLYSGYTCWRFVVESPPGLDRMQEMWGRGRRLGLVPLAGGRLYCYATANAKAGVADPDEGRIERFKKLFRAFSGFAPAILEQLTRPEQLIHNDLEEMPKHPWYKGRVLLIGDAAHATTPNMGQGAAMALEDAGILCKMLEGDASFEKVIPAFAVRRESRVRFIVDQSRRFGRLGQLENSLLRSFRNGVMRMMPQRLTSAGAVRAAAAEI